MEKLLSSENLYTSEKKVINYKTMQLYNSSTSYKKRKKALNRKNIFFSENKSQSISLLVYICKKTNVFPENIVFAKLIKIFYYFIFSDLQSLLQFSRFVFIFDFIYRDK